MPLRNNKKIIIGISGASGTIYGIRMLEMLNTLGVETHLIITKYAKLTMSHELDIKPEQVMKMASYYHNDADMAAPLASGSFRCDGMIIAPCSVKTLSEIAYGSTSSLITRAADVALKERRKLLLLVRESPLHIGHINSMKQVTLMGGIIMPPVNSFYAKPKSVDDLINHTVCRALDQFELDGLNYKRWPNIDSEAF